MPAMIYYGEETMTIDQYHKKTVEMAEREGKEILILDGIDAEEILLEANALSLFGEGKCFVIRCASFGVKEMKQIREILSTSDVPLHLFVTDAVKPEIREKAGSQVRFVECRKLTEQAATQQMQKWCRLSGKELTEEAARTLLQMSDYADSPVVNLYTLRNECKKLIALPDIRITKEEVEEICDDFTPPQVFALADRLQAGKKLSEDDRKFVIRQMEKMTQQKDFSALGVIALMERGYRLGIKHSLLLSSGRPEDACRRIIGVSRLPRPIDPKDALAYLDILLWSRNAIKNGLLKEPDALRACILKIMS